MTGHFIAIAFVMAGAVAGSTVARDLSAEAPYIEFHWQKIDATTGARQQALGLLMHPDKPHQFCWKSRHLPVGDINVEVTATDANGKQVWVAHDRLASHGAIAVKCTDIVIADANAVPGNWKFSVTFDGTPVASESIEVAANLATAHFYADPNRPYAIGRVNYTGAVAASQWNGHFLWRMSVGESGEVISAENVELVGAARQLASAGLHAARLFRFPPSSARKGAPFVVQQRYNLSPGG